MEVCRIVTKVIETGAVVPGKYVFNPDEVYTFLASLAGVVGSSPVTRWVECITQVMS